MTFHLHLALFILLPIPSSSKPPNILLLMVDDLRPELGCYGCAHMRTPNIDRLVGRSTKFQNAHAQVSLCGPSRTSLLTSRRPDTLTIYTGGPYWRKLPGNFTSLPQHLKDHGYHTVSIGKIFHPGELSGYTDDYPYSWSELPYHPSSEKFKDAKVCKGTDGLLHDYAVCPVNVSEQPESTLPDLQSAAEALRTLQRLRRMENPFFLAVGFQKPHLPFKYPEQYDELYPLEKITLPADRWRSPGLPEVAWNPFMDLRNREDVAHLNLSFPFGQIPDYYSIRLRRSYFAAVSYIDDLIGQILELINETGLNNNTIIVITSDHGWSLSEHQEWCKYSNYDLATRVPLSIYLPPYLQEKPQVHTVYEMVELVDLFPTLTDLAGLGIVNPCFTKNTTLCTDGKSLAPLMFGDSGNNFINISITQYARPSLYPQVNSDEPHRADIQYMGYAVKNTDYRYVCWVSFNVTSFTSNMTNVLAEELYDIYEDPEQDNNIFAVPEMHYVVKNLYATLLAVLTRLPT